MAVIPKRTKYRRPHRLPYEGNAKGNTELHFGSYGLQALEVHGLLNNKLKQPVLL